MTNPKLTEALLKIEREQQAERSGASVERIIERDDWRLKVLAGVTTAFWLLALIGSLSLFVIGGLATPMISQLLRELPPVDAPVQGDAAIRPPGPVGHDVPASITPLILLAKLTAFHIVISSFSVGMLVAAGLTTLGLIFLTRRTTLRQINENLRQLSVQLRQIQPTPQPEPVGAQPPIPSNEPPSSTS